MNSSAAASIKKSTVTLCASILALILSIGAIALAGWSQTSVIKTDAKVKSLSNLIAIAPTATDLDRGGNKDLQQMLYFDAVKKWKIAQIESDAICINGFTYELAHVGKDSVWNGSLRVVYRAQPTVIGADGRQSPQPSLPLRCK